MTPLLTASGVAAASNAGTASASGASSPLSVGFVDGSDVWPDLSALPWIEPSVLDSRRSSPATQFPSGDPALAGQMVRLTVHGLYPAATSLTSLNLEADLPSGDSRNPFVYEAWSLRSGTAPSRSNRVGFLLQIGTDPCVSFTLRQVSSTGTTTSIAGFGIGKGKGLAKLRRGMYLLGLAPGIWDQSQALPALGDPAWAGLASILVSLDR